MSFDWTINIGHLFTLIGFLITGAGVYYAIRLSIAVLTLRLDQIAADVKMAKMELQELQKLMVIQGRHDERITAIHFQVVNQGKRLDETIRRMNTLLDLRGIPAIVEED